MKERIKSELQSDVQELQRYQLWYGVLTFQGQEEI